MFEKNTLSTGCGGVGLGALRGRAWVRGRRTVYGKVDAHEHTLVAMSCARHRSPLLKAVVRTQYHVDVILSGTNVTNGEEVAIKLEEIGTYV